jgi:hypothetical protein
MLTPKQAQPDSLVKKRLLQPPANINAIAHILTNYSNDAKNKDHKKHYI